MTVSELFKKYDFESRGLYKKWTECETKPTNRHIRLVSRWEHTSPSIDMNCHVKEKNVFCYAVAD